MVHVNWGSWEIFAPCGPIGWFYGDLPAVSHGSILHYRLVTTSTLLLRIQFSSGLRSTSCSVLDLHKSSPALSSGTSNSCFSYIILAQNYCGTPAPECKQYGHLKCVPAPISVQVKHWSCFYTYVRRYSAANDFSAANDWNELQKSLKLETYLPHYL